MGNEEILKETKLWSEIERRRYKIEDERSSRERKSRSITGRDGRGMG